jgi:gliding motility-associated protein GldE
LSINFIPGLETDPYSLVVLSVIDVTLNPVTPGIIIALLCVVILLIGSALISGSEVAFFSLSPSDLSYLEEKNSKRSRLILRCLESPERLLATILITNNFINVGIVIISAFIMNSMVHIANSSFLEFLIQVIIITFVLLLFGEILPKLYANQFSVSFAQFMIYPVKGFEKLFYPVASFLIFSTSIVKRRLTKKKSNISMDDLSEALELAADEIADEKNILESIVKFGNIDVSEIMTSRIDIAAIDIQTKLQNLIPMLIDYGYSRIPVYADNFDNIKGILYIKDLLPHFQKSDRFNWQTLIRPPYYVPDNKKIDDLLREFQTKKIHMAIVVDEYGGTSGIITLEDIIEEIIGEIVDESDEDELTYQQMDDKNWLFDGKVLLNDFLKITDLPADFFDQLKGDADTLAGLILEQKGEIPSYGEKFIIRDILFTIESADKRRIKQIKVTL